MATPKVDPLTKLVGRVLWMIRTIHVDMRPRLRHTGR